MHKMFIVMNFHALFFIEQIPQAKQQKKSVIYTRMVSVHNGKVLYSIFLIYTLSDTDKQKTKLKNPSFPSYRSDSLNINTLH